MNDIPGSKPRKLIRKTNFSNPSLLSSSIKALWNPQIITNQDTPKRSFSNCRNPQYMPMKRSNSQQLNHLDSLSTAHQQFLKKKLSVPMVQSPEKLPSMRNPTKLMFGQKDKTEYSSSMGLSNFSNFQKLNYISHESIKTKQRHGYDIISGFTNSKA